jgi:hypothetical protein
MNPDLAMLAHLRTKMALHNFFGSTMESEDWNRLEALETACGDIRTRLVLGNTSDPTY